MIAPGDTSVQPADRFFLLFSGRGPEPTAAWMFTLAGGAPDENRLRAAVARALETHAKAGSRVAIRGRRESWEPALGAADRACSFDPPLSGESEEEAERERARQIMCSPMDPAEGPLVRVHSIAAGAYPARLAYRFHHALADGAGSLAFLRAVLEVYNGRPADPDPWPGFVLPAPLVAGRFGRRVALVGRLVALHARESSRRGFALPAKLYEPERRPDGGMASARIRVEAPRVKRLVSAARAKGATLAVLLLAALARAADVWRAERGLPDGMLRLVVSQDLRRRRGGPAIAPALENRSGAFPVWVGARDRAGAQALLASLTAQVRRALDARAAEATVAFSFLLRLPLRLARALLLPAAVSPRIADSLVFGFLGTLPPADGENGWLHVDGRPPAAVRLCLRPTEGAGALVLACVVDGNLDLTLNYLTGLFDASGAARYLELVDAALDELAAAATAPAPGGREERPDDRAAPAAAS